MFCYPTEKLAPFGPLAYEKDEHEDSLPQPTLPDSSATARFRKDTESCFIKTSNDLSGSFEASLSTGQK